MGFFATFWTWLNGQLASYIGNNTARLAAALEPAIVTLAVLYVMVWGYLQLTGQIEEPILQGLKRIATLALILGVTLDLWLYNTVIVDTFYNAPAQLAAAVVGAEDPVGTIDAIWQNGGSVAGSLWEKGHFYYGYGYVAAAVAVWILIGLLCVYAMFLISLSSIALAVLLALGPLFFASLFFQATKRFFSSWLSQLATYSLITVLTVMIAALLLQEVKSFAAQTAARGGDVLTVDALNMLLIASLIFLILKQVIPIASALGGGAALSTFGAMGAALRAAQFRRNPAAEYSAEYTTRGVIRVPQTAGEGLTASSKARPHVSDQGEEA